MSFYGSMIFYGIIAVFTAICAKYSSRFKDTFIRGFFAWNTVFIPALVAGLRYDTGTDYLSVYLPEFNALRCISNYQSRMEFNYILLNKLVIALGGGFQLLMFLVSFITILFIFLGLKQYKEKINIGLGMLVFMLLYYQISYNAVRQIAAMAIMFYALKYIYQRKFFKFSLFTIFACSFHITGLILFPFYFLYSLYGKPKYRFIQFISYIFLIILALGYNTILYPITAQMDSISYYAGYLRQSKEFAWSIGIFARTLPFLLPAVFIYDEIQQDNQIMLLFNMLFIGCIIRLTSYTSIFYTERIAYYFLMTQIVLVPFYFRQFKAKKMIWMGLIIISFVFFLWIFDFFIMGNSETVPYQFYFGTS